MKKIFINLGILVLLFGIMYALGHSVLYPIKNNNEIKFFSSKYNVDPYLVASIVNSDFNLSYETFNELAKEINVDKIDSDIISSSSFKTQCVSYLLSKHKSTTNLDRIINQDGYLNSSKIQNKTLSILRNKSWYKFFHKELSLTTSYFNKYNSKL